MPTFVNLSNTEFETLTDFSTFESGDAGIPAGYFDTFSLLFGWWNSELVAYRYINLGNFYICQSNNNTYYVCQSNNNTYYVDQSNSNAFYIGTTGEA
jgi:hypothetical protein